MSSTYTERKDKQIGDKITSMLLYGWYFYDPREQKVFISANSIFLEDNYIMNHKPKGRIVLEEVMGEPSDSPTVNSNTK